MFFTNDVLLASGGKFSIIWLAATRKNKLKRKHCDAIDIIKTCGELKKNFRPLADGRMTTIKGFSLRLSAQLVYGVSVVYNMKVIHLYKDTSTSVQNLHRFQSQLQLYPLETVVEDVHNVSVHLPETLRVEDPFFGQIGDETAFGSGYLTQVSTSDGRSDESFRSHQKKEEAHQLSSMPANRVKDLSSITLPEDVPRTSFQFVDDQHLLEGDELAGPGIISDIIRDLGDKYSRMAGAMEPQPSERAAAALKTPSAALKTTPSTPPRPTKVRPISDGFAEEILAVPLASPRSSTTDGKPASSSRSDEAEVIAEVAVPLPPVVESNGAIEREASDTATSDLVLPPLTIPAFLHVSTTRAHPSLIVDKRIELDSEIIKDQLRSLLNTIEDYVNEGNMDYAPSSFVSTKQFFEQSTTMLYRNKPSHADPYKGFTGHGRARRYTPQNVPDILFDDILKQLPLAQTTEQVLPGFAAHQLMRDDTRELLRPEDEFEQLQNGPQFDESHASGLAADETFATERSSISGFRDASRLSAIPRTLGEGFSSFEQGGVSGTLEQSREVQVDVAPPLNDDDLEAVVPPPNITDILPSAAVTKQNIEQLEIETGDGAFFSSLAPPGTTSRLQAAQTFFNILS